MKSPFRFIGLADNKNTIDALRELTYAAEKKLILGCVVIPIMKERTYSLYLTDEAARSKTFTAGAVGVAHSIIKDYAKEEGFR